MPPNGGGTGEQGIPCIKNFKFLRGRGPFYGEGGPVWLAFFFYLFWGFFFFSGGFPFPFFWGLLPRWFKKN